MNAFVKSIPFLLAAFSFSGVNAQATYTAQNIGLLSNWDDPSVPAEPVYSIRYNGIWGWDDGNGNEYALIGASSGVYFVNVTVPTAPVVADFVPGHRTNCIWREIKTYGNYAYLVSDDASPNSFQIVDMQYLPDSVHVVHDSNTIFERSHTIFVDGNKLYCGTVKGGVFSSTAAMAVFDLTDPAQPTLLRKLNTDFPNLLPSNQVHDMFVRNDTVYASCGFDGLFIFKHNTAANNFTLHGSITSYPSSGYNHSSALTDDGATLVFMDEVPNGLPVKVYDVSDFSNMTFRSTFQSNVGPTPHNPFMVGKTCYIAYYQDGLQVYDVSNTAQPVRLGYFDTHNQTPWGGPYPSPAYQGAWGAYPYLPSGNVLVSDMQNGLFVLDVSSITTGFDAAVPAGQSLSISPNPVAAGQEVLIKTSGLASLVEISDTRGRVLTSSNAPMETEVRLSTSGLESGLYLVRLTSADGVSVHRLVVR
jgi:choice-of-anchor B domain-containing protein